LRASLVVVDDEEEEVVDEDPEERVDDRVRVELAFLLEESPSLPTEEGLASATPRAPSPFPRPFSLVSLRLRARSSRGTEDRSTTLPPKLSRSSSPTFPSTSTTLPSR
jgi:hypothetical protein